MATAETSSPHPTNWSLLIGIMLAFDLAFALIATIVEAFIWNGLASAMNLEGPAQTVAIFWTVVITFGGNILASLVLDIVLGAAAVMFIMARNAISDGLRNRPDKANSGDTRPKPLKRD